MKRKISSILFTILLVITSFTACSNDIELNSSNPLEETSNNSSNTVSQMTDEEIEQYLQPDNIAIRWGMPRGYYISNAALAELNKALIDRGYDFHIEFVEDKSGDYFAEFSSLVNQLDIASTGFNNNGNAYKLVKSGYFTPLNEYLSRPENVELVALFDEKLWKRVQDHETIYSLPNGVPGSVASIVFLFNKEYVSEKDLENFTGDISDLKPILEKIPGKDGFSHILCNYQGFTFCRGLSYDDMFGVWLAYDGSGAYNPFDVESCRNYFKTFHEFYFSEYMGYPISFETTMGEGAAAFMEKALKNGDFVVYFTLSSDDWSQIGTDYIIVEMDAQLRSSLAMTTGIVSSSEHKEEAFEFLKLAYTDPYFANLLVYGAEGVDYQLVDGRVASLDGSVYQDAWLNPHWIGIYESATPVLGEEITIDRRADQLNYFKEKVIPSPYLGKHFDTTGYEEIIAAVDAVLAENYDLWKAEDIEAEMDRVSQLLVEAGINELTAAINEQFGIE